MTPQLQPKHKACNAVSGSVSKSRPRLKISSLSRQQTGKITKSCNHNIVGLLQSLGCFSFPFLLEPPFQFPSVSSKKSDILYEPESNLLILEMVIRPLNLDFRLFDAKGKSDLKIVAQISSLMVIFIPGDPNLSDMLVSRNLGFFMGI